MSKEVYDVFIFIDGDDLEMFNIMCNIIFTRLPCSCYTWTLMDNNFFKYYTVAGTIPNKKPGPFFATVQTMKIFIYCMKSVLF